MQHRILIWLAISSTLLAACDVRHLAPIASDAGDAQAAADSLVPAVDLDSLGSADVFVSSTMCPEPSGYTCTTAKPPSYKNQVAPIIEKHCDSCHTGMGNAPWSLGGYERLAGWADGIAIELRNCAMPPDGAEPFSQRDRETLWQWLLCGTPNN